MRPGHLVAAEREARAEAERRGEHEDRPEREEPSRPPVIACDGCPACRAIEKARRWRT
ncbi:MAG: hypothetical protein ABR616_15450 [Dermatophilaceae bacterium]